MKTIKYGTLISTLTSSLMAQPADHLVFEGDASKPGKAKHIVLLAGDEEYRSEEAMPMLAQILADQGFKCTVLFSMDEDNKFISTKNQKSLSNPAALDSADAILMSLRFRNWSDKTFDTFSAAFERGIPVSGLRTSTHAFKVPKESAYHKYDWRSSVEAWKGGFGRQVFGETWVSHWGAHAKQGMNTYPIEANKSHPILRGVDKIFCRSDLYEAKPLQPSTILLEGQITETLERDSKELTEDKKGAVRQPCAWTREFKHENGKISKIFTTTMGSSEDLTDENLRRLVINSIYYGLDLEVPEKTKVDYISNYVPTFYGTKDFGKDDPRRLPVPNMKPVDYIEFETPHK